MVHEFAPTFKIVFVPFYRLRVRSSFRGKYIHKSINWSFKPIVRTANKKELGFTTKEIFFRVNFGLAEWKFRPCNKKIMSPLDFVKLKLKIKEKIQRYSLHTTQIHWLKKLRSLKISRTVSNSHFFELNYGNLILIKRMIQTIVWFILVFIVYFRIPAWKYAGMTKKVVFE